MGNGELVVGENLKPQTSKPKPNSSNLIPTT